MYHWYLIAGHPILAKTMREAYKYFIEYCKEDRH